MGYVLVFIGLILTIAGTQGTQGNLYGLVQGDFTGQNSFIYWLAAIAIIGGLGYIPSLKGLSSAFLTLLLLVFVLSNSGASGTGLFGKVSAALQSSTQFNAVAVNE